MPFNENDFEDAAWNDPGVLTIIVTIVVLAIIVAVAGWCVGNWPISFVLAGTQ